MRIIVGITGASGALYGIRLLKALKDHNVETHLVITEWGAKIIEFETDSISTDLGNLASCVYDDNDLASRLSSGSFKLDGMIVIPCSMKTVASISAGYSSTLLTRAADVVIKEGRKLILVPRETPLSTIHLKNLLELSRLGVIILPAMPSFYHNPKTIDELVDQVVGKILDQFDLDHRLFKRWHDIYES